MKELTPLEDYKRAWALKFSLSIGVASIDRVYFLNYICRVEQAVSQYIIGRNSLVTFLLVQNKQPWNYYTVLHHFEQCVALIYQGICLAKRHMEDGIEPNPLHFIQDDGSSIDRLNKLYNDSKHSYERIANDKLPVGGTGPIWLTNSGIESVRAALSYAELHELLCTHIVLVRYIVEQFPRAQDAEPYLACPDCKFLPDGLVQSKDSAD